MRRALDAEAGTNPDIAVEQAESDKTDPEIELDALEAEIAKGKERPSELLPVSSPIHPVEDPEAESNVMNTGQIRPPYERIIQQLFAFRGGRRHCVILVASAAPGEGASTVARDLAVALGQSQNGRVVLVDANLRHSSQRDAFKIDPMEGLADVLRDGVKLTSVLRVVPQSGITVLSAGADTDGASQLLTVSRVQKAVTSLHSQFDWVILDSPAVTTFPDASSLAVVADGAILVLQAEQTRWEVAEEAKKILDQAGVNLLGGVLNRRKHHIPDFVYRRL